MTANQNAIGMWSRPRYARSSGIEWYPWNSIRCHRPLCFAANTGPTSCAVSLYLTGSSIRHLSHDHHAIIFSHTVPPSGSLHRSFRLLVQFLLFFLFQFTHPPGDLGGSRFGTQQIHCSIPPALLQAAFIPPRHLLCVRFSCGYAEVPRRWELARDAQTHCVSPQWRHRAAILCAPPHRSVRAYAVPRADRARLRRRRSTDRRPLVRMGVDHSSAGRCAARHCSKRSLSASHDFHFETIILLGYCQVSDQTLPAIRRIPSSVVHVFFWFCS